MLFRLSYSNNKIIQVSSIIWMVSGLNLAPAVPVMATKTK
jgi:hypothetical protein